MAPVCFLCKQAISSAYPGRPVNDEWQHSPSCPKPGQRTRPFQRVTRLWCSVTSRLTGKRRGS